MRRAHGWLHAVFGLLNLALAAPAVYLMLGLPLLMRQHGWSGTEIGLFQLAGMPALLKAVLAMPVERGGEAGRGYRRWAMLTGGGYVLALALLAGTDPEAPKGLLFALILAAALFATWADIPVNALAIRLLPAAERPRAGGVRSAALFAGAILGGGAMLLLQQAQGWAAPFVALAALLVLALALLGSLPGTPDEAASQPEPRPGPAPAEAGRPAPPGGLKAFFRQPGAGSWTVLLLGYFPFVAAAWVYLKPLLLDHGFPPSQVAWIAGIGGGTLGALASLATGRLLRHEALTRALPLSAFANALVLALLAAAVAAKLGPAWLMAAAALLALAMGVTSSLAFALMMDFARGYRQAADYGLQASLFALGRLAIPPVAGLLLDRLDYSGMLAALGLAAVAVAALATLQRSALALRPGGTGTEADGYAAPPSALRKSSTNRVGPA